jgi:hypothetical protein
MQRREFIVLLGGVAAAVPLASAAQQAVKRVGLVGLTGSTSMSIPLYQAFQRRLAELGVGRRKEPRIRVPVGRWAGPATPTTDRRSSRSPA